MSVYHVDERDRMPVCLSLCPSVVDNRPSGKTDVSFVVRTTDKMTIVLFVNALRMVAIP